MPRPRLLPLTLACFLLTNGSCVPATAQSQPAEAPYRNPTLPIDQRVTDLLSRMTPEEKVAQLACPLGWPMYFKSPDGSVTVTDAFKNLIATKQPGALWATLRADPWTKVTLKTGLSPRQSAEAVNALQRYAIEHSRLGIPLLLAEECAHGHMAIGATVFPTGIGQASTWDPDLIRRMGRAVAAETRACGATVAYGPVLDLAREPRWSRVEETYGEDPVLTRDMGVALVRGFQGDSLTSNDSVLSTLKHFAAHGAPEGGHNAGPANVGRRELLSAYLEPFRGAVRAGAGSVMSAYNEIDGLPCNADHWLLTDLLRGQWHFNGFVVSDLYAIDGLANGQRVAANLPDAAATALAAGVDQDLGANCYAQPLLDAVKSGRVPMDLLDRAVGRVLRAKFALGLFENPYADPALAEKVVRSESHQKLAYDVAAASLTLLKNNGLLPLRKDLSSIAVIGPSAHSVYNQLGDYTAPQPDGAVTTVLEGIRRAASPQTTVRYARGCAIRGDDRSHIQEAVDAANASDVAVLVLGGSSARDFNTLFEGTGAAKPALQANGSDMESGEGFDRATLDLGPAQQELLRQVIATGKPTVVVMIQGRPLNLNYAADHAAAILTAWYPGEAGGAAIADALFGSLNPAGRLPLSIPRSVGQLPVYYNAKPNARRDYLDESAKPLYPFGHGLSYTTFSYANATATITDQPELQVEISCDITNTGPRPGDEVVQLYLHPDHAPVTTPDRTLKAFRRIPLAPNETKHLTFTLRATDLALLDRDDHWRVPQTSYTVLICASSTDTRLKTTFTIPHPVTLPNF